VAGKDHCRNRCPEFLKKLKTLRLFRPGTGLFFLAAAGKISGWASTESSG